MRQPVPFGKYLLLDRISVGGMAEVFKAKSYGVEGFEKIIAIKRILPTMGEDRDFIKMFIDEAKIAGQLAHANICQIFELGRIDGSHFIAMEYIWGKDLLQIQNRLRKIKQAMPVAMACFSIAKVLEGLDYAHRKRDPLGRPLEIVHRDCSPQNVLVSYEGEVKVIDFGIAKATSRNSRTMAGVLKGKFGYMSPEQVRGLPLDRRSDIFAIGTMLYECLTGDRLFQGETDFSTLEKVRNVDIKRPREINPNIPEAVERVIMKALAKDVDERYQWCSEMLADLQQFLMSQDVVFTAKSLSGWLKEVFASEIDRERQQLEQYKRVGRDGLIAGVPAAAAKLDIVATLGEAGMPESDATQLGGPNFDEFEQAVAVGAAPQVGPAPGSPASRPPAAAAAADDDDPQEFGDEAPTEVFGEAEANRVLAEARASTPAPRAQPSQGNQSSGSRPVAKGPASRPHTPTQRPAEQAHASPGMPSSAMQTPMLRPHTPSAAATMISDGSNGNYAAPQASPQHGYAAQPPQAYGSQPGAQGTPNAMPVSGQPLNAIEASGQPLGRTLMGAAQPPGVPNYSQGYPPQAGGQHPQSSHYPNQSSGPYSAQQSGQHQQPGAYPMSQQYPSQPQMGGYPSQVPAGHMMSGQVPSSMGYAQYGNSAAVDSTVPVVPEGKKKSSIGRDVAIGVAIAALVLGGFLAVKFFVLDKSDDAADTTTTSSSIATLRLAMPPGISAELYVDDKKIAAVSDKHEIPVNAGLRKVKLLGPNGARCEQEMKLAAGKVTTVECIMYQGSATGSGSADTAGSAAGSDSTDKAATDKAATDKAATDKAAMDKAATDAATRLAADKAAADKAAADKAARDKAAADKLANKTTVPPKEKVPLKEKTPPKEKMPVEENPIDKVAALPSKGTLKIVPPPGATILVDGVAPTGSISKLSLTPGKHKVTFQLGTDKHTFSVVIKAGETFTLDKKDLQ